MRASPAIALALPLLLILLTVLSIPAAAAEGPDHILRLDAGADPEWIGTPGPFLLNESTPGDRFTWSFDIAVDYLVLELRIAKDAFDVERPKQIQPRVDVSDTHYPLFVFFPHREVWDVDGPAQVYHLNEERDRHVLRLGFAGPLFGTLVLEKDTEAPVFTLGETEHLDEKGFYQETTTDEPAIGDLLVRPTGNEGEPVHNPTPQFAYLQKFPIQGLDPDTDHDVWFTFTDWSDNVATSEVTVVRTIPRQQAPSAIIEPLTPAPDATFVAPGTPIVARITAPAADSVAQVRLFVDLTERTSGWTFEDSVLRYAPDVPFAQGLHRATVEVHDAYGNIHYEQWNFWVGMAPEENDSPAPTVWAFLGLLVLAALAGRRR